MYTWNEIEFKLNGFLVGMVIIDVILAMISTSPITSGLKAIWRNAILLILILVCCILRIKIFESQPSSHAHASPMPDFSELALGEEQGRIDDFQIDDVGENVGNSDCIQFKSVVFTYLGGIISLKSMSSVIMKQCQYFGFAVSFHAVFFVGFWIWSAMSTDSESLYWLRNANFYCMLMCLLPVPGFDGAGLLTIYLKEKRQLGKLAITTFLLVVSCIVTTTFGIIAMFMHSITGLYLAVYCGLRVLQYVFNPKDENMKVLRTMAKATKKVTEVNMV